MLDMFHRETGALSATKDILRSKWQKIHAAEKKAARFQLQTEAKERLLEMERLHEHERLQREFISQQHGTGGGPTPVPPPPMSLPIYNTHPGATKKDADKWGFISLPKSLGFTFNN